MEENKLVGVIEETSIKPGETNGKKWKRSTLKIGGKIFASFDEAVAKDILDGNLRKDIAVEINFKTDGKYNNIVSIFPADSGFKTADKVTDKVDWESKEKRIIRQNVLNRAVEMCIAGKITQPGIYIQAEEFEKWIWRNEKDKTESKEEIDYDNAI
jgi:hypothetical protein